METMGERLKWCRNQFGWTQEDLSRESKVGIATIRRIEQHAFDPRIDTVRRLAGTLKVREGWLAFGEEPIHWLWQLTGDEQIRAQTGPGSDDLPGFVVVEGGPWYRDGDDWKVATVAAEVMPIAAPAHEKEEQESQQGHAHRPG